MTPLFSISQSPPQPSNTLISDCKLPLKPTNHSYLTDCFRQICEHTIPLFIVISFGFGVSHCYRNFWKVSAQAKSCAKLTDTKTARITSDGLTEMAIREPKSSGASNKDDTLRSVSEILDNSSG